MVVVLNQKVTFFFLIVILATYIVSPSVAYALNAKQSNIKTGSPPEILELFPDNNTVTNDTTVVFRANITDSDGDLENVSLILEADVWEMFYNATSGYYERTILFDEPGNYTWKVVARDASGNNISSEERIVCLPEDLFKYPMPEYNLVEEYNTTSVGTRDNELIYITWLFRHALYVHFTEDKYFKIEVERHIENETINQQNYTTEMYTSYVFYYHYITGEEEELLSIARLSELFIHIQEFNIRIDFNNATSVLISPVEVGYLGRYPIFKWNVTFCNITVLFGEKNSTTTVHFTGTITVKGDEVEFKLGLLIDLSSFKVFRLNSTTGVMEELKDECKYSISATFIHDVVISRRVGNMIEGISLLPTKTYENGTAVYEYKNTTISTIHLNNEFLDVNSTGHYDVKYANVNIEHVNDSETGLYFVRICYTFGNLTYGRTQKVYLDPKFIYYGDFCKFVIMDNNPPEITIIQPKNGTIITSNNIVIEWEAVDRETGVDYFCISIDNHPWITIGRGLSYTITELEAGNHTVKLMAVDLVGNYRIVAVIFMIQNTSSNNARITTQNTSSNISIIRYAIYSVIPIVLVVLLVSYVVRASRRKGKTLNQ